MAQERKKLQTFIQYVPMCLHIGLFHTALPVEGGIVPVWSVLRKSNISAGLAQDLLTRHAKCYCLPNYVPVSAPFTLQSSSALSSPLTFPIE